MLYVKIAIYVLIAIICVMVFRFVYGLLSSATDVRKNISTAIDKTLRKKNKYTRTQQYLSQVGVMYRFRDNDLSPANYIFLRAFVGIILAVLMFVASGHFVLWITVIAFIAGYVLCDVYFRLKNKNDNEEMLKDLFNIYLTLKIQLASNLYITDSLQSCRDIVQNKRLQTALDELIYNLSDRTRTYSESVDVFKNRFKSDEIINLCTFLHSYKRYGVTEKYLSDIMSEINEISSATTLKEESDVENKSGIINFLFFSIIVAIVAYGAFTMIKDISFF